jgi:hypothetical protein
MDEFLLSLSQKFDKFVTLTSGVSIAHHFRPGIFVVSERWRTDIPLSQPLSKLAA